MWNAYKNSIITCGFDGMIRETLENEDHDIGIASAAYMDQQLTS